MENLNRKLILSNFKCFNWWLTFKMEVLNPLIFKVSYKDTAIIKKISEISLDVDTYSIKFTNMRRNMDFSSIRDDPNYVKLNIETIEEQDIFNHVYNRSLLFWIKGISYIAWLYKNYPTYNVPFSDLELKFIDNWLQSVFILDEAVRFFNYSPYELKINEALGHHLLCYQIVSILFSNKYIFETLMFWWGKQDVRVLTANFPFDITVLSKDAGLFFYIYYYLSSLSVDTKTILKANMFDYPAFDAAEKAVLTAFEIKQNQNINVFEDEINKVYKDFIPFKLIRPELERTLSSN